MAKPKPDVGCPTLLAIGLFALWVAPSLTVDIPKVAAPPVAMDTAQGIAIAAHFGNAAISLSWR